MEKVRKPFDRQKFLREYGILLIFIVLVIVMSILSPNFAQPKNLVNILKQTSINGILSLGMMFVIISGGFDLSIGSIVAVTGVVAAYLTKVESPHLLLGILACVGLGAAFGLLNGVGIAFGNLPPFIMTLGTMTGLRGLALVISNGQPVAGLSPEFIDLSSGFFLGVPYLAVYFIIAIVICAFVLTKTVYGRRVYACGGNMFAARVSGINVKAMQTSVYVIAGILAGVAGYLLSSRTTVGSPTAGDGYEMDAITSCVIGGISMSGGTGKWIGVVIGALLITVIANGLDILGVSSHYQKIVKGVIIVVAVLADVKGKSAKS